MLSANDVPGIALNTGDMKINKVDRVLAGLELII